MISIERIKSLTQLKSENTLSVSYFYKKDAEKKYSTQVSALFEHIKNNAKTFFTSYTIIWNIEPDIDFTIAFSRFLAKNISFDFFNCTLSELKIAFVDKLQKNNLQSLFRSQYTLIHAAGGLVYNDNKQILLIHRKNKWDLPKGKVENYEDIQACAVREVCEETGIQGVSIVEKLATTYHEYVIEDKHILKKTDWFLMKSNYQGTFEPQLVEDITQVCWKSLSYSEIDSLETYPLIKYVLKKGLKSIL